MMIQPANRISEVKEYYFSKKLREIDEMRQQGIDVINLGIGNPDRSPSEVVLEELNAASANEGNHGYQSYIGIPELRNAFSGWYQKHFKVTIDPAKEILPLMGSKEGIMHISMAFLNKGDKVLVPNPGYPTYASVSNLVEADIVSYELKEELNWQPDFEALEKMDLTQVKLMWVNYPNMPTGANATLELFEKLVAFGKKHEILICNDNPYSFILNDNPLSIFRIEGAKDIAIELNSLSKSHNMAGWRIGMVAANPTFIQYILRVKSNMDSGMFKPLQLAASKALSLEKDWYVEVNKEYLVRRELVWEIMDILNCKYDKNQSGMFIWAKVPETITSAVDLSDKILNEAHVFITPGTIFGKQGDQYIRISLCSKQEVLEESITRIKNSINL
ncbi:pyridoxal phosphate-dependent aminotransferase [Plebeiibacterium sediminum]|uniref:Aminotransferase n=1 Tax=Plebeiibacterium sediminum TaxID=2992112 RepID=A0AAE3SGG6_9BACT|nr:aminotransferase class I/II-fold pyridoxal phosphate-dependent enzyme [Plebeiobacterium sediminum]MCW3787278.1 aminotransferase class I/II-fold pyridoxal phosphate-dependent enzyme [Plebeiobacterium sediminum]